MSIIISNKSIYEEMKTVEIETVSNEVNTDRLCNYLERFVLWLLVSAAAVVVLSLLWETRTTLHIRNDELRQSVIMQNAYQKMNHPPPVAEYFMP